MTRQCDVLWAGEDGEWHTLPATYHSKLEHDKEYWRAQISLNSTADKSLPGNIKFALRYRTQGREYWDNKHGLNYSSQADSGIEVVSTHPVLNIGFENRLNDGQKYVPITVSVNQSVHAKTVTIHWTTDNWQHTIKPPAISNRNYWDKNLAVMPEIRINTGLRFGKDGSRSPMLFDCNIVFPVNAGIRFYGITTMARITRLAMNRSKS